MSQYSYKAINEAGKNIKGVMTAVNEIDLEDKLEKMGLYVLSYKLKKDSNINFFNSVPPKELILFCLQLEQLEKAGLPILESLDDIKNGAESTIMKSVIAEIIESVKSGTMLSASLALHPKIFNEVFIGLVAAGENTGQLHTVFYHLGNHLKWLNHIRSRIKKASYYPIFLLFLMICIISLMMLFVIPKLSSFLSAQNFDLPTSTKLLIATSNLFQTRWYLIFGIPIVFFTILKILIKFYEPAAFLYDKFKLNIPIIGKTIRKIEIARFCRFLGITFRSGISILDCLDISANVVINKVIKEGINIAKDSLSTGQTLSAALRSTEQFPTLVIRMIKIGENSGNLDSTLENVNFFYDREVEDSVNKMLGSIQPTLTILLGGIMFWVTSAVFGPLYSSFSKLNV